MKTAWEIYYEIVAVIFFISTIIAVMWFHDTTLGFFGLVMSWLASIKEQLHRIESAARTSGKKGSP